MVYIPILDTLKILLSNEAVTAEVFSCLITFQCFIGINRYQEGIQALSLKYSAIFVTVMLLNSIHSFLYSRTHCRLMMKLRCVTPLVPTKRFTSLVRTTISGLPVSTELAFYFQLGNLHPRYRSTYKSIQLLALCKAKLISKYTLDVVLKPIIEDIKKLVR